MINMFLLNIVIVAVDLTKERRMLIMIIKQSLELKQQKQNDNLLRYKRFYPFLSQRNNCHRLEKIVEETGRHQEYIFHDICSLPIEMVDNYIFRQSKVKVENKTRSSSYKQMNDDNDNNNNTGLDYHDISEGRKKHNQY